MHPFARRDQVRNLPKLLTVIAYDGTVIGENADVVDMNVAYDEVTRTVTAVPIRPLNWATKYSVKVNEASVRTQSRNAYVRKN